MDLVDFVVMDGDACGACGAGAGSPPPMRKDSGSSPSAISSPIVCN